MFTDHFILNMLTSNRNYLYQQYFISPTEVNSYISLVCKKLCFPSHSQSLTSVCLSLFHTHTNTDMYKCLKTRAQLHANSLSLFKFFCLLKMTVTHAAYILLFVVAVVVLICYSLLFSFLFIFFFYFFYTFCTKRTKSINQITCA